MFFVQDHVVETFAARFTYINIFAQMYVVYVNQQTRAPLRLVPAKGAAKHFLNIVNIVVDSEIVRFFKFFVTYGAIVNFFVFSHVFLDFLFFLIFRGTRVANKQILDVVELVCMFVVIFFWMNFFSMSYQSSFCWEHFFTFCTSPLFVVIVWCSFALSSFLCVLFDFPEKKISAEMFTKTKLTPADESCPAFKINYNKISL